MKIILLLLICIPYITIAQVKEEFNEQLKQDQEIRALALKLKKLNSLLTEQQLSISKLDSLIRIQK